MKYEIKSMYTGHGSYAVAKFIADYCGSNRFVFLNQKYLSFHFNNKDLSTIEFSNGTKYWYNNIGELHRENGPAQEIPNNRKSWYFNGVLHRCDGPAVEWISGTKEYWNRGRLHNENGPAIEYFNPNIKYWYLNGINLTEEEFNKIIQESGKDHRGNI